MFRGWFKTQDYILKSQIKVSSLKRAYVVFPGAKQQLMLLEGADAMLSDTSHKISFRDSFLKSRVTYLILLKYWG